MEECNTRALISLKVKLKLNVRIDMGLLDKLPEAANGFMSRVEVQAVQNKPNAPEQMDLLIDILLGKRNVNFWLFCTMLRDSNNGVWADELEKKAKEFGAGKRARGKILTDQILHSRVTNWLYMHKCSNAVLYQ